MLPAFQASQAPIPPPAYHRARRHTRLALHIDALTLVRRLHLLVLCRLAVEYAHWRCPPPLPAGPGDVPVATARRRCCSSRSCACCGALVPRYARLVSRLARPRPSVRPPTRRRWPTVRPSPSQQWKRAARAGAPVAEALLVVVVRLALRRRMVGGRDLIVDSAPILAWRRADPDAAVGHAPAHHPRPLLRGYRVHTLLCRGSGLPLLFLLSPANVARRALCPPAPRLGDPPLWSAPPRDPPGCWLLGLAPDCVDPHDAGRGRGHPVESQTTEEPLLLAAHLDRRRTGQTQLDRTLLRPRLLPLLLFRLQRPPLGGWSAIATQVALTYAATVVVGLAAHQAGPPRPHPLTQARTRSYLGGLVI